MTSSSTPAPKEFSSFTHTRQDVVQPTSFTMESEGLQKTVNMCAKICSTTSTITYRTEADLFCLYSKLVGGTGLSLENAMIRFPNIKVNMTFEEIFSERLRLMEIPTLPINCPGQLTLNIYVFIPNVKKEELHKAGSYITRMVETNMGVDNSTLMSCVVQAAIICMPGLIKHYIKEGIAGINIIGFKEWIEKIHTIGAGFTESQASFLPLWYISLILFGCPGKGYQAADFPGSMRKRFGIFTATVAQTNVELTPTTKSLIRIGDLLNINISLLRANTTWVLLGSPHHFVEKFFSQAKLLLQFGGLQNLRMAWLFAESDTSQIWTNSAIISQYTLLEEAWGILQRIPNYAFARMLGHNNDKWNISNFPDLAYCSKRFREKTETTARSMEQGNHVFEVDRAELDRLMGLSMDRTATVSHCVSERMKEVWSKKGIRMSNQPVQSNMGTSEIEAFFERFATLSRQPSRN